MSTRLAPYQKSADGREEKASELYRTINWDGIDWSRLLEARKNDYRKAIDAGWQKVTT